MGTPEFAVPSLRAVSHACDVAAVVTQPDRPRGRGRLSAASEVARVAEELHLETLKPERVNAPECVEKLRMYASDFFAVVAYGSILKPELLQVPRLGAVNLHGAMLPDYRGASPVQRALWDGRSSTGVTTIWIDEGIDTGDLILQRWAAIHPADNAGTLAVRLAELGAPLLAESLMLAHAGKAPHHPQDRAAGSYAPRLKKHDGIVDWTLDVEAVWNRQRAVTPWPGATARFRDSRVLITSAEPLHRLDAGAPPGTIVGVGGLGVDVACARGALRLLEVKPENRSAMAAPEWARGVRLEPREHFEPMELPT